MALTWTRLRIRFGVLETMLSLPRSVRLLVFFAFCLAAAICQAQTGTGQETQPTEHLKSELSEIHQSIHGTVYDNDTFHFVLSVPVSWSVVHITKDLNLNGFVGGLAAPSGIEAIMVQRYYVRSAQIAAQFIDAGLKRNLADYRKIGEGPMEIDKRDAYSLTFQTAASPNPQGRALPAARLLIVLVPDRETVLGFTCEAPEAEFDRFMPIFEKIVTSFRSKTE